MRYARPEQPAGFTETLIAVQRGFLASCSAKWRAAASLKLTWPLGRVSPGGWAHRPLPAVRSQIRRPQRPPGRGAVSRAARKPGQGGLVRHRSRGSTDPARHARSPGSSRRPGRHRNRVRALRHGLATHLEGFLPPVCEARPLFRSFMHHNRSSCWKVKIYRNLPRSCQSYVGEAPVPYRNCRLTFPPLEGLSWAIFQAKGCASNERRK